VALPWWQHHKYHLLILILIILRYVAEYRAETTQGNGVWRMLIARCAIVKPVVTMRVRNYASSRRKRVCCRKCLADVRFVCVIRATVDKISTNTERREGLSTMSLCWSDFRSLRLMVLNSQPTEVVMHH